MAEARPDTRAREMGDSMRRTDRSVGEHPGHRGGGRVLATGILLMIAMVIAACAPQPAPGDKYYVPADFGEAILLATPDLYGAPPGANHWDCVPSAQHPRPLILIHGFAGNMADSMNGLAPFYANRGYCVFAMNYGSFGTMFGGLADIEKSSMRQFGPFVDRVLTATGADQVDVIGHSEGSIMPRWWMRFGDSTNDDGTPKIATFIGIGPASHGADLDGYAQQIRHTFPFDGIVKALVDTGCGACDQVLAGSRFLEELNSLDPRPGENFTGLAQPGVRYLMLATTFDNFLIPYEYGFLDDPAVTNMTVQDVCPIDRADHLSIVYDPVAYDIMDEFLTPGSVAEQRCVKTVPVFAAKDQSKRR